MLLELRPEEERRQLLRWLGGLRWWAMSCAVAGALLASALNWKFVYPPGIAFGVGCAVVVNGILWWRSFKANSVGAGELSLHIIADLITLTFLLAFAGGARNPLSVIYCFHVVLGALLTGVQGSILALCCGVLGIGTLTILEHLHKLPTPPVHSPPEVLVLGSVAILLAGLGYFSLVLASRLRDERLFALRSKLKAEKNLTLLFHSLDALRVGLEVLNDDKSVQLRNGYADDIAAWPVLSSEGVPRAQGATRFAARDDTGSERVIDQLSVQPEDGSAGALLYVDRTEEMLVDQRHFMLERLATLGRALQGVAHELNTPLMTMQTLAKDLNAAIVDVMAGDPLRTDIKEDLLESVEIIVDEARRCRELTQSLLRTAHEPERQTPEHLTALQVTERAVRLVGHSGKGITIDVNSLDVSLSADADRVLQVVMNLLQNALHATPDATLDHGEERVRIDLVTRVGQVGLRIIDHGSGLPQTVRDRLFEPFITTRSEEGGTGLGLYTSYMIAQDCGGDLSIVDGLNGGTAATLWLPEATAS